APAHALRTSWPRGRGTPIVLPATGADLLELGAHGGGGPALRPAPHTGTRGRRRPAHGYRGASARATGVGRITRRSVMIAVTSACGVTSKAGFTAPDPAGATGTPAKPSTSAGSRSSIGTWSPGAV